MFICPPDSTNIVNNQLVGVFLTYRHLPLDGFKGSTGFYLDDIAPGPPLIIWGDFRSGDVFEDARNNARRDKNFSNIFSPCSLSSLLPIYFLFKCSRNFSLPILLHFFEVTLLQRLQQKGAFISHSYFSNRKLGSIFKENSLPPMIKSDYNVELQHIANRKEEFPPLFEINVEEPKHTYRLPETFLQPVSHRHQSHQKLNYVANGMVETGQPHRYQVSPSNSSRDISHPSISSRQSSRKSPKKSSKKSYRKSQESSSNCSQNYQRSNFSPSILSRKPSKRSSSPQVDCRQDKDPISI